MVKTTKVNFRKARESDCRQLTQLFTAQYLRKKDESYFLWQYFKPYWPTILMVACAGEQIIGTFGMAKRKLNNGLVAGQAIDLLIAPEWRGKGVFKDLGNCVMEEIGDTDLFCCLPNLTGKIACQKAFGWHTLGRIDTLAVRSDLIPSGLKELKKEELAYIWFDYSLKFCRWRFGKNPDYKYTTSKFDKDEFTVGKIFIDPETGKRFGDIVYYKSKSGDAGHLAEIFSKTASVLRSQKAQWITTWALDHTKYRPILSSLGFRRVISQRYLTLMVKAKKNEYLYDFSAWHLVQADCEIF